MNTRIPREFLDRAATERPQQWQPAAILPEPDKQAGYSYRWVRVSNLGKADPSNLSAALREGWEAVGVEEQPQFQMILDPESRFKDKIEVGGLLLCKTPAEFVEQRRKYYGGMATAQMESVDNTFMNQSDPRMPLFRERKSKTTFGSGNA